MQRISSASALAKSHQLNQDGCTDSLQLARQINPGVRGISWRIGIVQASCILGAYLNNRGGYP
jgi:hypothetical protein